MAAAVACRKRSATATATAFMDEVPEPPQLAKRRRFSLCPAVAAQQPTLAFDPLAALLQPQAREREAAAARVAGAAARADGGGMEECAAVLVEQMSAAADVADARSRASWILKLIEGTVAKRAAALAEAALREENGALKAQAAALREENGALRARAEELERDNGVLRRGVAAQHMRQQELERDNGVLKRGVATLHRRQEEAERAAEELKKKLAAANYALGVQTGGADRCRFQAFHGHGPDVF